MATDRGRWWRRLATLAFVAALISPLALDRDSVPLSRYPMYAWPRSATVEFVVPRGVTAQGSTVALSTRTIAATADPLIAESWLREVEASGRAGAACAEIADRVDDDRVVAIEIRLEFHDVTERAQGSTASLVESSTAARCAVTGATGQ